MPEKAMFSRNSIQTRMVAVLTMMLGVILCVNFLIFGQINSMVERVDQVFVSNVSISDLAAVLDGVQQEVGEYLSTKSSYALENYYRFEQSCRDMIGELNGENVDNDLRMLEKNIRNMSESYLDKTGETVLAKRGRNVERYRMLYEEQTRLYRYIHRYIYELNSERFALNSINYRNLLSYMNRLEWLSMAVLITILLLSLAIGTTIVRGMVRPLTELAAAANQVAAGSFDVELPPVWHEDEVGIVTQAFVRMLSGIRENIAQTTRAIETQAQMKERELSMEAHLRQAQLKYLQAQMDPHFLFNCLNAGAQLAMLEDAEQTGIFMEKMADYFRYNVKKMDRDATLFEEIEAVDNYIYILNVRYSGDITYKKTMAGEIPNVAMPGMILQPLVENAVQHGIRDDLEHGMIRLSVEPEDEYIRILISDNGAGMTHEQLQRIRSEQSFSDDGGGNSSTGIAVHNVRNRLRLYYNRDQLLTVHSEGKGMGTEVTVLLPVTREEWL